MAEFHVAEIFESINGEGRFAGELASFVRLKGCNLHCSYCDTAWACTGDASCQVVTEEQICRRVLDSGIRRVTLTGGEPLAHPEIEVLLKRLSEEESLQVEIETNGSIPIRPFRHYKNSPSFTIDYKLPGSGMEEHMCDENFRGITSADTVKFVVSHRADLERAEQVMTEYSLSDRCAVFFSPVFGLIEPVEIVEFLRERCLNGVKLQLQLHKFIWDSQTRGV
ncbi:MAG: putative 7-carboxy-7-deazaguanine synthase QueE [Lachnospiraceae bacterium]|nr:putative 7-carboxy-7-deazaguanine synthase QueE [Lachnospiraceae bacterium]